MTRTTEPSHAGPRARHMHSIVLIVLSIIAAWLLTTLLSAAATQNMLFDGAMNLEVSASLANGHGPKRLYGTDDFFPHGVQTKEPYVLVGAAVFKLFGVGPLQAQLPSLIYLAVLLVLVFVAVRRFAGTLAAAVAVVVLLSMPMLWQYGLNGYGEIPTLVFGLAGIAVVAHPTPLSRSIATRALLAGLLCGLAVATKVVGVSLALAAAFTLLCRVLVESRTRFRDLAISGALFACGLLAPLALVELWRWVTLGHAGYRQWWSIELGGILYQAGVSTEATRTSVVTKVLHHLSLLSAEVRRTPGATVAYLVAPIAAAVALLAPGVRDRLKPGLGWWLFALSLVSVFYIVWWMGITPTEKAWLRRIYIGLTCLSVIGSIALATFASHVFNARSIAAKATAAVFVTILCFAYVPFTLRAMQSPISFERSPQLAASVAAAELVSRQPQDALLFGYGWYAAPTISLYSGRSFDNLTDWPIGMAGDRKGWLMADSATFTVGIIDGILQRYPHRKLLQENRSAQVFEIDFSRPNDPFAGRSLQVLPYVVFNDTDYAATHGMQPLDPGMGGRWIASDSEILLQYDGQQSLFLAAYMPLVKYMLKPEPLSGRIEMAGCEDLPFAFEESSWKQFNLPLDTCTLTPGNRVRVRILTNNSMYLPLVYDHQRTMLLGAIGFQ